MASWSTQKRERKGKCKKIFHVKEVYKHIFCISFISPFATFLNHIQNVNIYSEIQEAYEVLYDDPMRKKYDEMRRYGMSQDQYKFHEAYERQTGQQAKPGAFTYEISWIFFF